jgi:hypothetical protein
MTVIKNSLESWRPRVKIRVDQAAPVTGTIYAYLLPPALSCYIFRAIAHVCTLKIAKDWLK